MNTFAIRSLSFLFYKSSDKKQVKLLDCLLMDYFRYLLSGFFHRLSDIKLGNDKKREYNGKNQNFGTALMIQIHNLAFMILCGASVLC